jgi:hypothetical protein
MNNSTKLLPIVRDSIYFDALLAQAKQAITTYAGQTWTDTGEHDPGVTLMEGFSYSVSDLAYRNTLPLTDLLTPPVADQTEGDGIFPTSFGPQIALTSGPITPDDYRRALLDLYDTEKQCFYFRNVQLVIDGDDYAYWYNTDAHEFSFEKPTPIDGISPIEYTLRGNYTLYLEPTRETQSDNSAATTALDAFLSDNRNLGESVSGIVWTAPQVINPVAVIELEDNVQDIASIYAALYATTEKFISPPAERYSAAALADQGAKVEEIYQGPSLEYGWIPDLPAPVDYTQRVTVNLGALAQLWLAISGIKSIVSLKEYTNSDNVWTWTTAKNLTYPQLWGSDPLSTITASVQLITAGGEYAQASKSEIEAELVPDSVSQDPPVIVPYGRSRDIAQYHPVSDKIPPCYGLQQLPPASVQPQLYQFLLPFEQMMANGCQQLAMLPQLLSFKRSGDTVWGEQWPYASGSIGDQVHAGYSDALITQMQANANDYDQELAILNYLLGYFGTQRASRMLDTSSDEFLIVEQDYLGQITDLAYHRDNIRIDQVSALQKRIAARLGLGSSLFTDGVDMGNLPFYLIEHRALLPAQPSSQYDSPIYPTAVASTDETTLTVTQSATPSLDELLVGQLIDFVLVGGLGLDNDTDNYTLQGLIVDQVDVSAQTFSLNIEQNPQLALYQDQIVAAATSGSLYWQNCKVWLQDIQYPLDYAENQTGVPTDGKIFTIPTAVPFPALVQENDVLLINAIHEPDGSNSTWSLKVTVKSIDDIAGTVTVARAEGETNNYPADEDVGNYYWYDQNSVDRFSFIVSVVLNKAILPQDGDSYTTELWVKQCVQAELPAHVSIMIHWLDDQSSSASNYFSFQGFAQTYASWQQTDTAPSAATYQLLWMLSLGRLPARLTGIGAMTIASDDQRTAVVGAGDDQWNINVIVEDGLFFVPKTYSPSA